MNRWSSDDGFTLVEFVIALTIISMTIVLLLTTGKLGSRVGEVVRRQTEQVEETVLVRRVLKEALTKIVPLPSKFRGPALIGGDERLAVRAMGPRPLTEEAPIWMILAPGEGGRGLAVQWRKQLDGVDTLARRDLGGYGRTFRFEYMTPAGHWLKSWTNAESLPLLVRLSARETSNMALVFSVSALRTRDGSGCYQPCD